MVSASFTCRCFFTGGKDLSTVIFFFVQWLKKFLPYLDEWKTSVMARKGLSSYLRKVERAARSSQERRNLRKTVLRYEDYLDIELNPTQDDELLQLVTAIDSEENLGERRD